MRNSIITGVLETSDNLKTLLHQIDDGRLVRTRVHQPHLGLHGEGVAALLNDAGAFSVILAEDDENPALDPGRGEVGQRVGGDVGADRRFPDRGATHGIVDRSATQGRRRCLVGAAFEMYAEVLENVAGVGQHVHEMRDRRALIPADIGDAGLQQRLGDGEYSLSVEGFPVTQLQAFDFLGERPFHAPLPDRPSSLSVTPRVKYMKFHVSGKCGEWNRVVDLPVRFAVWSMPGDQLKADVASHMGDVAV